MQSQPAPRRRIIPPNVQQGVPGSSPNNPYARAPGASDGTTLGAASGFTSMFSGHLRPTSLEPFASSFAEGMSQQLKGAAAVAAASGVAAVGAGQSSFSMWKLIGCIVLAVATLSLLSFNVIDIDAIFGVEEVHLPDSIFAKKKIAEPHDYDPISVAYLRKKMESKTLKPELKKKIADKLKLIDEKEQLSKAKSAQHPKEDSLQSHGKADAKKTSSDSGEPKSHEPIINPEIYKDALSKMHVGFSILFDKVKENIANAQENIDASSLKSSLNLDPNALKSSLLDQLKPFMTKLSLNGVDLSDSDLDGIPDVMASDSDADGIPDILEDINNDGVPDILDAENIDADVIKAAKIFSKEPKDKQQKATAAINEEATKVSDDNVADDSNDDDDDIYYGDDFFDDGDDEASVEEKVEPVKPKSSSKKQPEKKASPKEETMKPKTAKTVDDFEEQKKASKKQADAPKKEEVTKSKTSGKSAANEGGVDRKESRSAVKCDPFNSSCISEEKPHIELYKLLLQLCPNMDALCLMGHREKVLQDIDNDGVPDFLEGDIDQDGIDDYLEVESGERILDQEDNDGDGVNDELQKDTDGDGVADAFEDEDKDGVYDVFTQDKDGDGVLDFLEDDDDNEVLDFLEYLEPSEAESNEFDGVNEDDEEYFEEANPEEEIESAQKVEPTAEEMFTVADNDGDSNDDDDGIDDGEIEEYISDDDENGDGIPDFLEGDLDENGILDYLEDEEFMSHPYNARKYGHLLKNDDDGDVDAGQRKILVLNKSKREKSGFDFVASDENDNTDEFLYDNILSPAVPPISDNDIVTGVEEKNLIVEPPEVSPKSAKPLVGEDGYLLAKLTPADEKIAAKIKQIESSISKRLWEDAVKKSDELAQSNPNSGYAALLKAEALDGLAEMKRSNDLLAKAIECYRNVIKIKSSEFISDRSKLEAYVRAANRLDFLGKSAKNLLLDAVENYPNNETIARLLVVSHLKQGRNKEALAFLNKRIEGGHDEAFNLVHKGFVLNQLELYQDAVEVLEKGFNFKSKDPAVYDGRMFNALGNALIRLHRKKDADYWYDIGAKKGAFLSQTQRSLYNADRPIKGKPWWSVQDGDKNMKDAVEILEKNWRKIRDEALKIMNADTGEFEKEAEGLSKEGDWKQFTLYQRGKKNTAACSKTPFTCSVIDKIPAATSCKRGQIKFSVMQPGTYVWPHTGPTNCRIRTHLGLVVPEGPKLRVANEIREWQEGKVLLFDDSFEHEVWHNGKIFRLVLIVDLWHPELTPAEKRSMAPI